MKKFLTFALIFLSIFSVLYGDKINDRVKSIKEITVKIKKLGKSEEGFKKIIAKYENSKNIFKIQKRERYLKKLNKIQLEKNNLVISRKEMLKMLKSTVSKRLKELYNFIFQKVNSNNFDQIFQYQKEYIELKRIYDFYFQEKIDIIIHENEPKEILELKIKIMKQQMDLLKNDIKENQNILGKLENQIEFLKETELTLNSEFVSDYLEFLGRSKKYLVEDINKKMSIIDFYKAELHKIGGINHEKN